MKNGRLVIHLLILGMGLKANAQIDTTRVKVDSMLTQSDTAIVQKDTSYWKIGGMNALTSSQISLINWAAGGENSISFLPSLGLFADYRRRRHSWENSVNLAYGFIRQGAAAFTKADDNLGAVTKYGYQISNGNTQWYFSGLLDFRTQFNRGMSTSKPDSVISRFMAPAYAVIGLGIDFKPNEAWSLNYVPATGKFTLVSDNQLANNGAYGVMPGQNVRIELGSFLKLEFEKEILTNVVMKSRVELFTNYVKNLGNVDVSWQNTITMKVNKWITVNHFSHLIYDDDVKMEIDVDSDGQIDKLKSIVQYKSVLGVGISIRFGARRDKTK